MEMDVKKRVGEIFVNSMFASDNSFAKITKMAANCMQAAVRFVSSFKCMCDKFSADQSFCCLDFALAFVNMTLGQNE